MKSLLTLILIGILTAGLTFWYFRPVSQSSTSVTVITDIKELEELLLVKITYGACLKTENTVKVYVADGFIGIDLKNSKMEKRKITINVLVLQRFLNKIKIFKHKKVLKTLDFRSVL